MFVAGVDGCKRGWVVVLLDLASAASTVRVVSTFADVLALREEPEVIAADVPIGLLDVAVAGGRECESLARSLLGHPRRNSVFSAPVRRSLAATTFTEACALNRASSPASIGISQQSFALFSKLREVDAAMSAAHQTRVFEVHPELRFYEMANAAAASHGKKSAAGRAERVSLLRTDGLSVSARNPPHTQRDRHALTQRRSPRRARLANGDMAMRRWLRLQAESEPSRRQRRVASPR